MIVHIQVNCDAVSLSPAFKMIGRKGEVKTLMWFCVLLGQSQSPLKSMCLTVLTL